jgi:hypothetical protein
MGTKFGMIFKKKQNAEVLIKTEGSMQTKESGVNVRNT